MSSEARKLAGGAFDRGDIETLRGVLITPDGVLWRSGAMIPAASTLSEDLGFLTHHRIFACLLGNCGLQEITPEKG
jgi:hypothetical protein